jgi:hypothetical protein
MQVTLIVVEGQARKREVVLELPAIIGRSRAAAVTIGDAKVSRHHCELFEAGGLVMVRDNNSLNGTFVDGQQVKECVIRPGARLTVGPLTFVVLYEPSEEATHELPPAAAPVAGLPGAEEPDFAAWAAGDDGPQDRFEPASPDFLPPAADAPPGPTRGDVPESADDSTMAATPPTQGPSPQAKAQEERAAAKKSKSAKKPKSTEPSEPPAESQTTAPLLPTAASPAPSAPSAPGEVDFGWLAGEDSADSGTVHTDASDETVFDESVPAVKDKPSEVSEDEPTPSPPAKPDKKQPSKKKPGKKRSWWPFGKKKKDAEAKAADADEEGASESPTTPPEDAEPEAAGETSTDDASSDDPPAQAPSPEDAEVPKADDEGGLDDFLKGIGR